MTCCLFPCELLAALGRCGLRLRAKKPIICPSSATVFGSLWRVGTLSASPHAVFALSSCAIPINVKGLHSFIGAYKALARVIPGSAIRIAPLDALVAGRESSASLIWTEEDRAVFHAVQGSLSSCKAIVMPVQSDELWIVTDTATSTAGIGATLYITRRGKTRLAGFFSVRLKPHQAPWLPCEVEALDISSAVSHFSPYIIQSDVDCTALTYSKPCVQAIAKLCRCEFSFSPRVSTFLSVLSRNNVALLVLVMCLQILPAGIQQLVPMMGVMCANL